MTKSPAHMITIYHNPKCSKSRQTLQLIESKGLEPNIVPYLEQPPTEALLTELLQQLNLGARDIIRSKESLYKELELNNPALDESALIKAISEHPKLMERPIVSNGQRAVIGRPPENVLEII